ncbi:MAG: hypothetical protein WCJ31_13180 [Planctomycetia bacterium]
MAPCPACRSERVITGKYVVRDGYDSFDWIFGPARRFRPDGLKWLSWFSWFGIDVEAPSRFNGCTSCGLLWASIDHRKLAEIVKDKGTAEARASIGLDEP